MGPLRRPTLFCVLLRAAAAAGCGGSDSEADPTPFLGAWQSA